MPTRSEAIVQFGEETERARREDLLVAVAQRRGVQIIRGGKESMIYYDVAPPASGDAQHEAREPIAESSGGGDVGSK